MHRKLLPRSIYDVMAAIACIGVLAGGTAYAANTVFSSDIVDGEVKSVDIGNNEIGSADVKDNTINTFDVHSFLGVDVVDGSLEDQDIAQGAFYNFAATIPATTTGACANDVITGVESQNDHLLLTPLGDAQYGFEYHVSALEGFAGGPIRLHVCNHSGQNAAAHTVHFNLLVIDAQ
jgi:hypothetical protein